MQPCPPSVRHHYPVRAGVLIDWAIIKISDSSCATGSLSSENSTRVVSREPNFAPETSRLRIDLVHRCRELWKDVPGCGASSQLSAHGTSLFTHPAPFRCVFARLTKLTLGGSRCRSCKKEPRICSASCTWPTRITCSLSTRSPRPTCALTVPAGASSHVRPCCSRGV